MIVFSVILFLSPFAIGLSYLVQRIGENSKGTWIIGGLFDFGPAGLKGLQFDINYGRRTDRHTVIAAANTDVDKLPTGLLTNRNMETATSSLPATDWDELATDLIYTFAQEGFFKNLRLRDLPLLAAHIPLGCSACIEN
jgi:hypothetical protein